MKVIKKENESATVELTDEELMIFNNALNEICNGIDIPKSEFIARIGVEESKAKELLKTIEHIV